MKTQRGVTLIEMMIAITIGLFLVVGLGVVFLSLKQTSDSRQTMSLIQNNQRFGMIFLNAAVSNAGYFDIGGGLANTASTVFPSSPPFAAGQSLLGGSNGTGKDTISVRFMADANGKIQGCSNTLQPGHVYMDTFSYTNYTYPYYWGGGTTSDDYLQCQETDITTGVVKDPLFVVKDVIGIAIVYGVDTTGGGAVKSYMTAAQVSDWSTVKTVTVTLTFKNPLAKLGQPKVPATLNTVQTFSYMNGR